MSGNAPESGELPTPAGPPSAGNPRYASIDAFVSYASHDAPVANSIVETLEKQGLRCWIAPRNVPPGSHYADHIMSAISRAKVLVLVLSDSALGSKHVGKEVERASSKGRPIIALRTDAAPLTPAFEYFLGESQWIDAAAGGLAAVSATLVEAVRSHADAAPATGTIAAPSAAGRSDAPQLGRRVISAAAAVVAVLLGFLVVDNIWLSKRAVGDRHVAASTPAAAPAAPAISEKSIAVLPFTDMSEKKDQEFFADGMTEEIINLLASVPDLHVSARTSSFSFKGKSSTIPEIAHALGVAHVLEGSVRKSGSQLRVTAQLVRADNGYHLWSQTYDRDLRDVFKLQDDIANAVVQALRITLMGGPLARQQGGTQNLAAYMLYLRARSVMTQNSKATLAAGREDLEQAIKLDPNFGLAWVWLASTYSIEAEAGYLTPQQGYERGRKLAQRALQLSPELAEACGLLSYVERTLDWDWPASERDARRALALGPRDPEVLAWGGLLSMTLGHWDEADRRFRLALEVDPLNPYRHANVGMGLYGAGRFAEAESSFRKTLELAPDFAWGRLVLAKALLAQGKAEAALAVLQRERDDEERLELLPSALHAVGRKAEADAALQELIARFGGSSAYWVAANYAQRGDYDRALHWLDRAYETRDTSLVEIVGETLFKNLADEPRFKAFLRKMNLPE